MVKMRIKDSVHMNNIFSVKQKSNNVLGYNTEKIKLLETLPVCRQKTQQYEISNLLQLKKKNRKIQQKSPECSSVQISLIISYK